MTKGKYTAKKLILSKKMIEKEECKTKLQRKIASEDEDVQTRISREETEKGGAVPAFFKFFSTTVS